MDIYGDLPPLTAELAKELFPNLDTSGYEVTSDPDRFYNCFAWGAEDTDNRWEPTTADDRVWFAKSTAPNVSNFVETYGYVGFVEEATTAELEDGIEKLALYVLDGEVTHAARQLEDGSWTSKLGNREDVTHRSLECLQGDEYGYVERILQRKRGETETWRKNALTHHLANSKNSKS